MSAPIVPECTGKPDDCVMCDMIRNIFDGFPSETDPGCEVGNAETDTAGLAGRGRSLAESGGESPGEGVAGFVAGP